MKNIDIVAFLTGPYDTFYRRPLIEALGSGLSGRGRILCIEPWTSGQDGTPEIEQKAMNVFVHKPHIQFSGSASHQQAAINSAWKSNAKHLRSVADRVLGKDGTRTAWIYRPEQIWTIGLADESYLVYECCNDYRFDLSGRRLNDVSDMDRKLLRFADLVFAASEQLYLSRAQFNDSVHLLPNGVDFHRFSYADTELPADLAVLPGPRIGNIGSLTACDDLNLLHNIVASRPEWSFVHIGPIAADIDITALRNLPNLHFLGVKPQAEMPAYVKGLDVGMMLFNRNRFTNSIDPLKLYEYLAAGIPVVSTRFAPLGDVEWFIQIADSPFAFLGCLDQALQNAGNEAVAAGREYAQNRDWTHIVLEAQKALGILEPPILLAA